MARNVFNENGLQAQLAELPGRWSRSEMTMSSPTPATFGELIRDERSSARTPAFRCPGHEAPITHP